MQMNILRGSNGQNLVVGFEWLGSAIICYKAKHESIRIYIKADVGAFRFCRAWLPLFYCREMGGPKMGKPGALHFDVGRAFIFHALLPYY